MWFGKGLTASTLTESEPKNNTHFEIIFLSCRKERAKASDDKSYGSSIGKSSTGTSKAKEDSSKPEVIDLDTYDESKVAVGKSQKPVTQLTVSQRLSIAKRV